MGRSLEPKCKQCRRAGEKLFLKGEKCFTNKCPIVRRNYPPGVHGVNSRRRLSNYGLQLQEKQKAKRLYRLGETQFYNYYAKAVKGEGETAENLGRMLERRLDNVVFRLGLGISRDQARQLVNHGHFQVNGRSMTIPSYQVKVGDTISVKQSKREDTPIRETLKKTEKLDIPAWLKRDQADMTGTVTSLPSADELQQNFQPQLIIEYYSR
ncbi:MAG: 30S ribosomal protein S4 [bacterium]|nr:30S ribosomal protein S4 [bacterium]